MDRLIVVLSAPKHATKVLKAIGAPTIVASGVEELGTSWHVRRHLESKSRQGVTLGRSCDMYARSSHC